MSRRVLVVGAGGMLGRDIVPACIARGHEVFAAARSDLDVTDARACDDLIADIRPDMVINCAAYTDVDGAETDEEKAMDVNKTGAAFVAMAAARVDAAVMYISTDYVFDGRLRRPYVEADEPAPLNVYGQSKWAGEVAVATANSRHMIVRTSSLFGLGGRNFIETMLRLADEQPEVAVVSDQVSAPTSTLHLAKAVAELADSDRWGVHHVAAAGECSWFEFAQEIFDQAGLDTRVMAVRSSEYGRPAKRPAYSVLRSASPQTPKLPHWREGLATYLDARERRISFDRQARQADAL